ncbi:MAG: carbamoyltransferase HypF [Saprospiraceae bacterium]|nr:carbamoyltransferase HypF [Saprospiraceae bacterium]
MTYHIHIQGIVQGVGFRPFIYKLAIEHNILGFVSNGNDGVNIIINGNQEQIDDFVRSIKENAPEMSHITELEVNPTADKIFNSFKIVESDSNAEPKLLFAPDFTICEDCLNELYSEKDKRFQYPFLTCTNCGPRFSIISALPYDRENTTMGEFKMCPDCQQEYDEVLDRRYYSQTNSCPKCGIKMEVYDGETVEINQDKIVDYVVGQWKKGKIVSIKGIGGFLTTCDANNKLAIENLRHRKNRPDKPLALMYPDIAMISEDTFLTEIEAKELKSKWSPIVLLKFRESLREKIYVDGICHGLNRVGVMLPYTPLFDQLLKKFNAPVVATSGNISGSTIIFDNNKAKEELMKISDILVLNNRDIVVPQDDSVIKYSGRSNQRIVIRRSRGIAPSYIDNNLKLPGKKIIATGAMLKSVFTLINNGQIYISQFLGNTDVYDSQLNYTYTLGHFIKLLRVKPEIVLIDKHPAYFSHIYGMELAQKYNAEIISIQHHKAHFAAVMGEYNLHSHNDKVLGVIFDGTGYGDDGQIWGGEFFVFENKEIVRHDHLPYFDFILGDKMVREPRISALSISHTIEGAEKYLKNKFSDNEWKIYNKLLNEENNLMSSSIGRVFDAVSSLLFDIDHQTYEGQAAMMLETQAECFLHKNEDYDKSYFKPNDNADDILKLIFTGVLYDLDNETVRTEIAAKFHISIVDYIAYVARKAGIQKLAFSGGVFQNGLIVELIYQKLKYEYQLFFHNRLSPNDECISFGQVVFVSNERM